MNSTEQTLLVLFKEQLLEHISIDSRSLNNSEKTVFFALKGPHHNGHDYINELINQKVKYFVVDEHYPHTHEDQLFFRVKDPLKTLQSFAQLYRKSFNIPVIGITGSNGKTIVKEWLSFLLSPDYFLVKNPKSYNSQVGVPLSVVGIQEHHQIAIFEAGISTYNEMENLQKIIQPTIGLLTNIGAAHDDGFDNVLDKIKEKLLLFSDVEVVILQKNKIIENLIPSFKKTFTWSYKDKLANVFVQKRKAKHKTILLITYAEKCFRVEVPFVDVGSVENVVNCLMVLLYLKYDIETIQDRIKVLYPISMRLVVKQGINQTSIIDDSYSADLSSLKISLDFLESQKKYAKKTVILSDILQSGMDSKTLYENVALLMLKNKVDRVIAIGKEIMAFKSILPNCLCFVDVKSFLEHLNELTFFEEMILIKGARDYHFEQIVAVLEQKTHETVFEINLNALTNNLQLYKSKLDPTTKIMVMVKAFAYGNGSYEVAKLLEFHHVDYLGVAFADEGIALKQNGISTPIMVLNPEVSTFENIIKHQLEPEIYSFNGLHQFLKIAKEKNLKNYPIHIKIDTGMHRLGFLEEDIEQLALELSLTEHLMVKSVLSHLAASDDKSHDDFTKRQISLFDKCSSFLTNFLVSHNKPIPIRHILNSSGIINYPEAQFDMVRLGIGLYGVEHNTQIKPYLEMVGTLKSVISQIKNVSKGASVGYSRAFVAQKDLKIATIPIGYADGIHRIWGNGVGYVNIRNHKAPIVGNICMDMLMVDVSEIPCQEGNEVIVLGDDPNLNQIAKSTGTIEYEILTNISQRVKRVFFRE